MELLVQAVTPYREALEGTNQGGPVPAVGRDTKQSWERHPAGGGAERRCAARWICWPKQCSHRAALEVRTKEDLPQEWARTQNNLGTAILREGERTTVRPGDGIVCSGCAGLPGGVGNLYQVGPAPALGRDTEQYRHRSSFIRACRAAVRRPQNRLLRQSKPAGQRWKIIPRRTCPRTGQ